jgi:hypothetical protein
MKNIISLSVFTGLIIVLIAGCSNDDEPKEITYNSTISEIMTTRCVGCHSGNSPSGNLSLTTYSEVKTIAETDTLMSRLNDSNNPMPPTGLLPQDDRNTIQTWIDNCFQE